MIQRMEHSGLIERRPDPEDARISRVYLTERGRALKEAILEIWSQLEAQTIAGLSPIEQAFVRRLLSQMLTYLGCYPPPNR